MKFVQCIAQDAGGLRRSWQRLGGCSCGTATLELTLVLPIFLSLALMLAQTAMLMVGHIYVHYAASAAARSAIVQIPADAQDEGGEPRNELWRSTSSPKMQRIHLAAALALVPTSGQLESGSGPGAELASGVANFLAAQHAGPARWTGVLGNRMRYAAAYTSVEVAQPDVDGETFALVPVADDAVFGPRDPVTVIVEHRQNLALPYVGRIFADGAHTTAGGRGYYTLLRASCTLTNEGVNWRLPPTPRLPRE